MLFLTRLKILLRRKETLFWVLIFPLLLATAEYLAFGNFVNTTPIDTIPIGIIMTEEYAPSDYLVTAFQSAKLEENKDLFALTEYDSLDAALLELEENKIILLIYKAEEKTKIEAKTNSTELTVTASLIRQTETIIKTIEEAYQNGYTGTPVEIFENILKENNYFKDISTNKNATFYTIYFYALIAMACLYAALFGVRITTDIRADRSSLGIRISSSVVSKPKLIISYFSAAVLLQFISSCILYIYLALILKISLGANAGLILLTMILGGIAGVSFGMFIGTFKLSEKKSEGVITIFTLGLSALAGLMNVEIKHMVTQNMSFINYINPAAMITDSLYALYYYDTYTSYILYTCLLFSFSLIMLSVVLWKTRGEKYASL